MTSRPVLPPLASTYWRHTLRERLHDTAAMKAIDAWIAPAVSGLPLIGLIIISSAAMSALFNLTGMAAIRIPTKPPQPT